MAKIDEAEERNLSVEKEAPPRVRRCHRLGHLVDANALQPRRLLTALPCRSPGCRRKAAYHPEGTFAGTPRGASSGQEAAVRNASVSTYGQTFDAQLEEPCGCIKILPREGDGPEQRLAPSAEDARSPRSWPAWLGVRRIETALAECRPSNSHRFGICS
jgi:hypothetical protein